MFDATADTITVLDPGEAAMIVCAKLFNAAVSPDKREATELKIEAAEAGLADAACPAREMSAEPLIFPVSRSCDKNPAAFSGLRANARLNARRSWAGFAFLRLTPPRNAEIEVGAFFFD